MEIEEIVERLRRQGSDTEDIEAKRATGGFPTGLAPVLSALANRPGGGTIVFGLDEAGGFRAAGVYDVRLAQQAMADVARINLEPPVTVTSRAVRFEGADVVIFAVHEAATAGKPVVVKDTGLAYLRQYDGTYPLSDQEKHAFILNRTQPDFDAQPVRGATVADLDEAGVAALVRERRLASSVFTGWDDATVLRHIEATDGDGRPTLAGLLSLGTYPQRFVPNAAIQASAWSGPARRATSTLLDNRQFAGAIPAILDDAMRWVAQSTPTAIVARGDGHLYDVPQYPPIAVRELVANALTHRDLSPFALTSLVSLTLEPGRLIVTSPGGLYGIRVEALGHTESHLRNSRLANILLATRTRDGRRVIERLGSGIPRALSALADASMPPASFHDTGLRFTAIIDARPAPRSGAPSRPSAPGSPATNAGRITSALTAAPLTAKAIQDATGLTRAQTRYALASMITQGVVAPLTQAKRKYYRLTTA